MRQKTPKQLGLKISQRLNITIDMEEDVQITNKYTKRCLWFEKGDADMRNRYIIHFTSSKLKI